MSTRFDDDVEASWGRFEQRLAEALAEIGDSSFGMELPEEPGQVGASPYVQFAGYGDWVRAEVASNEFLDAAFRMDAAQEHAMESLGWAEPVADESPNYWFDVTREQIDLLPSMVAGTLRHVFGIVHPGFLSGGPWPEEPEEVIGADEEASPSVVGTPRSRDELVEMVRATLVETHGDDIVQDGDGDFPTSTGTVPIWVRVEPDKPIVRVFSFLVAEVRDLRQARIEIDILNRRLDYVKLVLVDEMITASVDLPAVPYCGDQLHWVLARVGEQLDDVARDTAQRVRGSLWFEHMATLAADDEEQV